MSNICLVVKYAVIAYSNAPHYSLGYTAQMERRFTNLFDVLRSTHVVLQDIPSPLQKFSSIIENINANKCWKKKNILLLVKPVEFIRPCHRRFYPFQKQSTANIHWHLNEHWQFWASRKASTQFSSGNFTLSFFIVVCALSCRRGITIKQPQGTIHWTSQNQYAWTFLKTDCFRPAKYMASTEIPLKETGLSPVVQLQSF